LITWELVHEGHILGGKHLKQFAVSPTLAFEVSFHMLDILRTPN